MRKTIITLVVALATLVPGAVFADGMPPSSQKPAGGEAGPTASSKVTQADLAPDAPDQYTVVKGDTLWGIASKFLKDPWKWPQIWQMNQDRIKDPHWIYPGDVIKLDRSGPSLGLAGAPGTAAGTTSADAAANVVKLDPRIRVENLELAIPSIPGSAIGPFLSQPLVVEAGVMESAPTILATEESRMIVGAGDLAYAKGIASADGVNWQVYRPGVVLRDPETNEVLGIEAKYVGDARVRRFGDPTTLEITKAKQEMNRGDRLQPARETTFSSYIPRAPDKALKGVIMSVDGGVAEFGLYQVVTINRGARDGIEVGHVLASYHRGAVVNASGERALLPGSTITLPDERNGLIFVFRVFEKMSYAMVVRSSKPMYIGDVVQTP